MREPERKFWQLKKKTGLGVILVFLFGLKAVFVFLLTNTLKLVKVGVCSKYFMQGLCFLALELKFKQGAPPLGLNVLPHLPLFHESQGHSV